MIEAREAVGNLVTAIAKGRHSAALLTALETAETNLATLEARRAGMMPIVVELPADLPRLYRAQVRHLAASLSHEVALGRASLALRDLIEKVVVTWDEAAQRHELAIEGRLGALLEIGGARAVEISPVGRWDTDATMARLVDANVQ